MHFCCFSKVSHSPLNSYLLELRGGSCGTCGNGYSDCGTRDNKVSGSLINECGWTMDLVSVHDDAVPTTTLF